MPSLDYPIWKTVTVLRNPKVYGIKDMNTRWVSEELCYRKAETLGDAERAVTCSVSKDPGVDWRFGSVRFVTRPKTRTSWSWRGCHPDRTKTSCFLAGLYLDRESISWVLHILPNFAPIRYLNYDRIMT
jgi:hypothetical protein